MPNLSCERLTRLLVILERSGQENTVRNLQRTFSIWSWEVDAAEKLGWVEIEVRKPRTGRASRVVRRLSETPAAKLPESREQLGRPISIRHSMFAMRAAMQAVRGGMRSCGIPPIVDAYQRSFPNAKSRAGAYASASRLLKHPDVRAAMQWNYAVMEGVTPPGEPMPETRGAILDRLRELGSWRVKFL